MKTKSVWDETKTFFPLFVSRIESIAVPPGKICIVGASDGKFVIPLDERGWHVIAIEVDQTAVYGGFVEFPKGKQRRMAGLLHRLKVEGLDSRVEVILGDFLSHELLEKCLGVFTSCSWHYSRNHRQPLKEFVEKMQAAVAPSGVFCAEYMMPCEPRHLGIEHYVKERQLPMYFQNGWDILEEFYTPIFPEKAHVGTVVDHIHRMGLLMVQKHILVL